MRLESVIKELNEKLEKRLMKSSEDHILEESEKKRKDDLEAIHTQIEEAQQEIAALNESIRNMEEARKEKTMTINAKKGQLAATTSELEAVREEDRSLSEKIKKFRERKVKARSEFSAKDVAVLEETKLKLRVCRALTGVHFNSLEEGVSSGFVANSATSQVKLFDVSSLPRNEATEKIWEAIKKTTAGLE